METIGKDTITIDLDETDVNSNVQPAALIQQACYRKLQAEITRDLNKLPKATKSESYPMGSGFVYFIDGTRGAGKSTFLTTTYVELANGKPLPGGLPGNPVALGKLAYIDPSRIERSEIILLPILKSLKQLVEKAFSYSQKDEEINEKFRRQFKRIAGGLSLFSSSSDQLKDIDAELFLDWGLERAENSSGLRSNLHALIHTACTLLDFKALVLAFDDADTNTDSAIAVLECIRKYLDTPELVVLVTGDMELYSQQVRDHFYDSLGKHVSSMDGERHAQRNKMVDHLEDQYLLKLFPIRRRVQLRPMWNLIEDSGSVNFQSFQLVCANWNGGERSLQSAIKELIGRGLRLKDSRDIALYFEFLLKQPLRSTLQILSRCAMYLKHSDELGKAERSADENLSDTFSESLRAMALGSLYKYDVDVDALGALEMPALVEAVFDLTVQDGELDTGAYLRPQPSDAALRNCFAALSADVSRFCANSPESLLHYLFSGPGSVAVYGQVLRRQRREIEGGKIKTEELRADFKKYIGIGRKEDALNWAWHATSILTAPYVANPKRPVVYFGVIGLNKSKPGEAEGISARTAIKNCEPKGIAPAFAFSLIDVSGQGVGTFASIFNTLGLLDRLLRLDRSNTKKLTIEVKDTLNRVYKTPTISRPGWEGEGGSSEESKLSVDDGATKATSSVLDSITQKIVDWLTKSADLRGKLRPSAVLIGKIWTRIYFSLEKVSEHQRGQIKAASLMELFALCIINAFLVEELDHHLLDGTGDAGDASDKIDRSNPLGAPSIVADKFHSDLVTAQNLPLTFLIASCPLIVGFLKQGRSRQKGRNKAETDVYQRMLQQLQPYGVTAEHLCDSNTWDAIESACIAGWSWTTKSAETPKLEGVKPKAARGKSATDKVPPTTSTTVAD